MLIIYFKSDGEIHQVATGYKTMEEFYGRRAKEFRMIFDSICVEENNYLFNNFSDFYINQGRLRAKNIEILELLRCE